MGQSFLTHDEKSTGSPSPDLLQFSGGGLNIKYFGSLSSVKELSTPSSSRSPSTSSSPRSPILLQTARARSESEDGGEEGGGSSAFTGDDVPGGSERNSNSANSLCESPLVPSPIPQGNVSRLREKFMDLGSSRGKKESGELERIGVLYNDGSSKRSSINSEVDCHFINRAAPTSPNSSILRRTTRGATLPTLMSPSSPRSRNSLYQLSPTSYYQHRHHRNALLFGRASRTLPTAPVSGIGATVTSSTHQRDGIRSHNDISRCFREMTLTSSCTVDNFTSETTPLVRQRPRTRPYVPPPRSVIIRAGYLPTIQTVNISGDSTLQSTTHEQIQNQEASVPSNLNNNKPIRSQSECFTSNSRNTGIPVKEELKLVSSSSPLSEGKHPFEERIKHVVTSKGDHTQPILKKDAGVNTSAEILVLPKGTKTSILLKSAISDDVDGKGKKKKLKKKRKHRGIRRITRFFSRIAFGFVELF